MPELIREARFFMIILDLFITAFSYLLVPVIFIIRGKKMARKQLWKISIINGCCVCFAFIVLRALLDVEGSSGAIALWMPIGYWIMSKKLLLSDVDSKVNSATNNVAMTKSEFISQAESTDVNIPISNPTNDKTFTPRNDVVSAIENIQTVRFCRKCGNKLIPNSAFCNKCGFKIDRF